MKKTVCSCEELSRCIYSQSSYQGDQKNTTTIFQHDCLGRNGESGSRFPFALERISFDDVRDASGRTLPVAVISAGETQSD